ncbi:MAG: hypothetical protein V4557_19985 [Bacteroidota bacterium]
MKALFVLLVLTSFTVSAQDGCINAKEPLDKAAFRKMINRQFNYAILGSNTPVSGFKFETAKPTITLTGSLVPPKTQNFILSLSLTGGVTDNIGQLFSDRKLNGYFKLSTGFNFALPLRKGIYNWDKIADTLDDGVPMVTADQESQKRYDSSQNTKLNAAFKKVICANRETISKQVETSAIVISALEVDSFTTFHAFLRVVTRKYKALKPDRFPGEVDSVRVLKILNNYLVKPDSVETENTFTVFASGLKIKSTAAIKLEQLLADYTTSKKIRKTDYQNQQHDYAIEKLKNIWVKTRTHWLNITPSIANSSLKLFDETTKHLTDSNSALYGIDISWNCYTKYKGPRYTYIRAGIGFTRTNNLEELGTLDYRTSARQASTTDSLFEEKTGTAYKGMIKHASEFNAYGELYLAPLKFPVGLYSTIKYRKSNAWLNKEKISLNIGVIWNVVNSDADAKNILSIIPYVGWSNILPDYSDAGKTKQNKASDLFSVNIKFGIPINLGK